MKKSIYLSLIALCISSLVFAQEFEAGDNVISGHIGLGSNFGTTGGSQGLGLSVNYERGIWEVGDDVIGLGAYLGTKTFKFNGLLDGKLTYTIVGIRGAYHFNSLEVEDLDLYAGAMISYNSVSFSGVGGNFAGATGITAYVGARYYFTDNLAASVEAGYGVSFLNLGVALKL